MEDSSKFIIVLHSLLSVTKVQMGLQIHILSFLGCKGAGFTYFCSFLFHGMLNVLIFFISSAKLAECYSYLF